RAAEHEAADVQGDVDEAANAGDDVVELRGVDVAGSVDLGDADGGADEPAADVEVELGKLIEDGVGVGGGAEGQSARGSAADQAALDGERETVQLAALSGDLRDAFGDADAEVDDGAVLQLVVGAGGDDPPGVERTGRQVSVASVVV